AMPGKTTGATGRARIIYLTPRAVEIVRGSEHQTGPLFRGPRGAAFNRDQLYRRFARLRRRPEFAEFRQHLTAEAIRHGFGADQGCSAADEGIEDCGRLRLMGRALARGVPAESCRVVMPVNTTRMSPRRSSVLWVIPWIRGFMRHNAAIPNLTARRN